MPAQVPLQSSEKLHILKKRSQCDVLTRWLLVAVIVSSARKMLDSHSLEEMKIRSRVSKEAYSRSHPHHAEVTLLHLVNSCWTETMIRREDYSESSAEGSLNCDFASVSLIRRLDLKPNCWLDSWQRLSELRWLYRFDSVDWTCYQTTGTGTSEVMKQHWCSEDAWQTTRQVCLWPRSLPTRNERKVQWDHLSLSRYSAPNYRSVRW